MTIGKLRFTSIATVLFFFSLQAVAGKPSNVPEVIVVSTIDGSGVLADPTVPNYRLQNDLLGDYRQGWTGRSLTFKADNWGAALATGR